MPKYWMITNREKSDKGLGPKLGERTYWVSDSEDLHRLESWRRVPSTNSLSAGEAFMGLVLKETEGFAKQLKPEDHEKQKHVTLFIHGYNNTWDDAARRYQKICKALYSGGTSLGLCILFNWPSDGAPSNYLPDRADARAAAEDLATNLCRVFDHLAARQLAAVGDQKDACQVKFSVIAHSMGNYLLQKAMRIAWTRKNQPLLVSLVNQLLMVAADVDNDLFASGEEQAGGDGDAIANLSYRVSALYSGRDSILGVSAGLKHFGKRRLGRSGLDTQSPPPDNVWQFDCSNLISENSKNVHSAYFESAKTYSLMRSILRGLDRGVIVKDLQ